MRVDFSDFKEWDSQFVQNLDVNSSCELHGILVGLLTVVNPPSSEEWQHILSQMGISIDTEEQLNMIYDEGEDLSTLLADNGMDLAPLIPEDTAGTLDRIYALADWCGGVLYGFGVTGSTIATDERDLMNDLANIANLVIDEEDSANNEDLEQSFTEILEYARLIPVHLSTSRTKIDVKKTLIWSAAAPKLSEAFTVQEQPSQQSGAVGLFTPKSS